MKEYLKKYRLYVIIGISILVLLIGGTLAYYVWSGTSNALVSLNVCTPTVTFVGGSTINGVDMVPVLTKENGAIKDIEVKKNSTCNRDVTMSLYLELTKLPTELSESSFVYKLYKNSETMAIASGNFSDKQEGNTITLLSNQILNTSKDTYTLYIYIDGNVDNPGTMAGKNFLFKLWGSGEGAIYKENVITTSDNPTDSTSKFFNTEVMREEIQSLTIAEDNTVPDTLGIVSKDISQNQDGTVMLWYTPKEVTSSDGTTKTMYDMWIGGENGVLQTGTNASGMFAYLTNIEKLDLSKLDTSYITNMSKMFYMDSNLKELDLSNFNTSNVTNMYGMFWECTNITRLDLSSFNTSSVTTMQQMFYNCSSLKGLDLSMFDTSNVTSIYYMFYGCHSLTTLDLSTFNTSKVTSVGALFALCSNLTSINFGNNFDVSNADNLKWMFRECKSLKSLDLSNISTLEVTSMEEMFWNCTGLESIKFGSNFKTVNVTTMRNMFYGCYNLKTLDLSTFNTSNVANMTQMFLGCSSLTSLNLSNFDTNNVTEAYGVFLNCSSLASLDIRNAEFSKVTSKDNIFLRILSTVKVYVKNSTEKTFVENNISGSVSNNIIIA